MVVRELITLLGFRLNDGPQKQYDKQIDRTKEKSSGLARAAKGVGTAWKIAGAAVAIGVGWISKNIISATVEIEGYRAQLQAFTGDAESAAAALAELREKTTDPLFGTGNLVNAYKQLRTVGMGAEETSRMIDVLGDCANGSVENFNSLNNILLRVKTSGKANEGTMRQLAMAGFGASDMAQGLGISQGQLNKMLADGKIGFEELAKAMQGATKEGGRFYMNAANQALTLGGSIKILRSTINDLKDAIGMKAAPALANLIGYITKLIKIGEGGLVGFGTQAFDYLIRAIARVIIFFEVLQMRMRKYGGAFEPLKAIFSDVFGFLKDVISSAYPFLMKLAQLILIAFKPIHAFIKPVLEALRPIIQKVFGFLSEVIDWLIPKVEKLTPHFEKLGQFIGSMLGPVLKLALAIRGVNAAIGIGQGAVKAFGAAQNIASGLSAVFSGNLDKMSLGFQSLGMGQKAAMRLTETFGLLTGKVDLATAAANKNRLAQIALAAQKAKTRIAAAASGAWDWVKMSTAVIGNTAALVANKVAMVAHTVATKSVMAINFAGSLVKQGAAFVVLKAQMIASTAATIAHGIAQKAVAVASGIATAAQWALNAAMTANPVGLIIAGVVALIAVIVLLVKNWDKVTEALKKAFSAIGSFFAKIWGAIVGFFKKIIDFAKQNALNIANVLLMILFLPAGIVMAVVRLIIKHWDKIKPVLVKVFTFVANKAKAIWGGIVNTVKVIVDRIKAVWGDITGFFTGLFADIKGICSTLWDGLVGIVTTVVDRIKSIWNGIVGFFSGLWDAMKEGPAATLEYIKNAFFGLFDSIKDKFFGFINIIGEGWNRVKGFFSKAAGAVINFVTGGNEKEEPTPANDLILTPEGGYSTHPDDYIMAMKRPQDLIDALLSRLGGYQPQPAYAGAGFMGSAMAGVPQRNYNSYNESSVTAPISINVNASGMSPDMASMAVKRGVEDALREAINGSRGAIPSPEARRG